MASEEKQEGKGFTVQDHRRFAPETGAERPEAASQPEAAAQTAQPNDARPAQEAQQEALPEINFSTFVISLSTQALMHLGEIANPLSGKVEADVPVAKQMIDILGMLKDKTASNLTANEDRLLQDILYDLRMRYVEAVKKR
ncbi:MAG: DUF1844 domain-containing protein [Deltaproteobacteria bacterium]|nr:DUF1844 domain-containing protein [Deltaproteobacteria bacterium]